MMVKRRAIVKSLRVEAGDNYDDDHNDDGGGVSDVEQEEGW